MMKFPIVTLCLSLVTTALFLLFGEAPSTLIWQASQLKVWQPISAHFVHISTEHSFWNVTALTILGSIIEQHSVKRLILTLVIGCAAVNVYLLTLYDLAAYAGLSGALNTLLIVALYLIARVPGYKAAAWLSFFLSVIKLLFEWHTGVAVFASLAWPAVPEAHFAGLVAGCCLCLLFSRKSKLIDNTSPLLSVKV